jgi:sulfatase maturation enzyme AslB (radical SAM superfamily)
MKCKFLEHGVTIRYDHVVTPCCNFDYDQSWRDQNHISKVDLQTWHQSPQVDELRNQLQSGTWPDQCQGCAKTESQGRQDSMRLGGDQAYADSHPQDIILEIRPGSVCNFACQTCWPAASSRVAHYHHQAGLINIKTINSNSIDDFEFLQPIADRVRTVIVLGGEPFYDPSCKKFLSWAQQHLDASITMFTNGSHVDWDWIDAYSGRIILIFSIDAVGSAAEYVRPGTDWPVVLANYHRAQSHPNVEVRVNITMSVYNYHLIEGVIDLLTPQWPSVVSFGYIREPHLCESSVPDANRSELITSLQRCIIRLWKASIESDQKQNTINAIKSVINNLQQQPFDPVNFEQLKQFVHNMDRVKRLDIRDSATPIDFS